MQREFQINKRKSVVESFRSNSKNMTILLIKGWNNFGDRVYSYSKIPCDSLPEIKEKIANNMPLNIRNYGTIIAAGLDEPSEELHHEIEREYSMAPVLQMAEYYH